MSWEQTGFSTMCVIALLYRKGPRPQYPLPNPEAPEINASTRNASFFIQLSCDSHTKFRKKKINEAPMFDIPEL